MITRRSGRPVDYERSELLFFLFVFFGRFRGIRNNGPNDRINFFFFSPSFSSGRASDKIVGLRREKTSTTEIL